MAPLSLPSARERQPWFIRLAAFVLVVSVLKIGRDVFIPIAFAMLLVFLLTPSVIRLTRWGLPKTVAIIVTVALAFSVAGGLGWLVTEQALRLGEQLPNYEQNLHEKIELLKKPHTPPALEHFATMLDKMRQQITAPAEPKTTASVHAAKPIPVPVEVHSADTSTFAMAREVITPVLAPLATAGIVIVFVIAMLFQREDLRARFMRLVGPGQLNTATQAVDDASQRVSRYLWMQLVVNAAYGIPIGVGLYFIGVPNALLWGIMATILRFVPYVGSWIAAAFPVVLSIVIDPGWSQLLLTVGLFLVVEVVCTNIFEVMLYSGSTGISSMALLVAAVFWTWLWGVGGLVLSTPLTVCLFVVGKWVPGLRGLSLLLGHEPPLEPDEQFYQAMLSMESEYMVDLANTYLAKHTLAEFYTDVFVPALILSEEDRHRGTLAEAREIFILQSSRDLIEELEKRDDAEAARAEEKAPGATLPDGQALPALFIGVPARDVADELAGHMLAHLLRRRGHRVEIVARGAEVERAVNGHVASGEARLFVSALPPSALGSARLMCRRLKRYQPEAHVVIGVWSDTANRSDLQARLAAAGPDAIVTTFADAITALESRAPEAAEAPTAPSVARVS